MFELSFRIRAVRLGVATVAVSVPLLFLTGCGTSSGSGGTGSDSTTQISGQAITGAVDGTVVVADGAGTTVASAAVTGGAFTVTVPDSALDGELDFTVTGSYTDEVSGGPVALTANDPLALRTAAGHFAAGQVGNAPITPGSTIVRALVRIHAMTLAQAMTTFQAVFGYVPDMAAQPFDPTSPAPVGATTGDSDEAFRAGGFSQLASDLGVTGDDIAALLASLADDIADGAFDGLAGGDPVMVGGVDLASRHAESTMAARLLVAYSGFAGSPANSAGVAAPSSGLPMMGYDSAGATRSVTIAGGRNVTVTLDTTAEPPFAAGYWTARVAHVVTLTDADGGDPIDVTTDPSVIDVSHHPMMHMLTGHNHTTPHAHEPDITDAGSGQYVLDAYYVMASEMGMGETSTPMGVWDYVVKISEDTDADGTADVTTDVVFHPQVKAPMGGALLFAQVSNVNDTWTNMTGTTGPRPYRAWLHEAIANGDGTHAVTLFVSTQDLADMTMTMDGMSHAGMTFPAVYPGQTLHGAVNDLNMRPEVTVDTVVVEVSTDGGTSWVPLTMVTAMGGMGTGQYTVADLSGLDNGGASLDTLTVRLTVNDRALQTAAGADGQLLFSAS